ncbi:hypothetical protein RRG08_063080 [Elysia crispata]|uniref:Uncharacterized protein n=1 Tax=Elysia crispata TaxID=231223 RepID=A0AAE0Y4R5_9GAST|nr:hypothetical protein RRG08_063080 [Elysia crispata]
MATELEEAAGQKISTLCHHGNRTGRGCRTEDQYTLSPWQQNWKRLPDRRLVHFVTMATEQEEVPETGRSCRSEDQYTLSPWQQNWKRLPDRRLVHFVTMATEQEEVPE